MFHIQIQHALSVWLDLIFQFNYQNQSMRSNLVSLTFLLGISVYLSSCSINAEADFDITLDPNIPGKINVVNNSINAKTFQWQLGLGETEDGTYSFSSDYGNYGVYEGDRSAFYIQENSWVEITLQAVGATDDFLTKRINVNNVPSRVVVGNLVVTRVSLTDELGYEWDDLDGTTGNPEYENNEEFPDLLMNNNEFYNSYNMSTAIWNVDIINGLPVTLTTQENVVIDDFSPTSSSELYIELVDGDGSQGSIFLEPGKRIGVLTIDMYRLTHEQNGGKDDNYPEIYKIQEEGFDADLYLHWD